MRFISYIKCRFLRLKSKNINVYKSNLIITCVAGIGDVLMTMPLLQKIYENFSIKPDILINSNAKDLFFNNPYVGNIIFYDVIKTQLSTNNFFDNYNIILSSRSNDLIIKSLFKKKDNFYFDYNRSYESLRLFTRIFSKLSNNYRKKYYGKKHIYEFYNEIGLDLFTTNKFIFPKIYSKDIPLELSYFISLYPKFLILHVGGSDKIRKLKLSLINRLLTSEANIILVGDINDKIYYKQNLINLDKNFNALGLLNINQLNYLIDKSLGTIVPDSMVMHLASLHNKPQIAIMGNALNKTWGPIFNKNSVILSRNPKCSPCSKKSCTIFNGFSCVQDISYDEIRESLLTFNIKI